MPSKNITIIGAGFAGLASALLLARDGHRVTILEKFTEPAAVGAGVLIQPTGLAAMRVLGIEDEIKSAGAKVDWLYGVNANGRAVVDIHYADWRADTYGVGLHRGVLFQALWRDCISEGVNIRTGQEVHDIAPIQTQNDLTIIADGAHSHLRAQTGLAAQHRVYPWGALWAVLADVENNQYTRRNTLLQWYDRASKMMGIMPTGMMPATHTHPMVSLFWSLQCDQYSVWRAKGLAAWKDEVLALNPDCVSLINQITTADQLTFAHYADVVMPRYHADRVVVIGDAAHATSPQLGQGTNMALLDAVTLAKCMVQHADTNTALAHYTAARKRHLHYYGLMSRLLTPIFQSEQIVLPWLRDWLMTAASRWPVARAMNRQTLVGVRGGWLRGEAKEWLGEV